MNLYEVIENLLKTKPQFVSDEGTVMRNAVYEATMKMDAELINLLLSDERTRAKFFVQSSSGVLVFDKTGFGWAVSNKQFLADSYTRFSNKIGLGDSDERYLTTTGKVQLLFPHKDCVLEGGQTKEDQKREEIFFNETLAPDAVDNLLAPKVFVGAKRYDSVHIDGIATDNIEVKDNLIVKGNNLLVISSLLKRYAGAVKFIYIDVPYNTGNDSFGYNDRFNHSTWLCFMKNRLEVARKLLKREGTIALSVDNYEIGYLLVLMDEVFGRENRKNIITVRRASATGAKVINPGVVNVAEYVVIYSRETAVWKPNRVFASKGYNDRYNKYILNIEDNYTEWKFITVLDAFAYHLQVKKSQMKKFLGQSYEEKLEEFVIANADRVVRLATLDEGSVSDNVIKVKTLSEEEPDKIFHIARDEANDYFIKNGEAILFAKDRLIEIDGKKTFSQPITDIWDDVLPNDLHNEGGVKFKKGKKPEKLLGRLMELCTNEGDLVLDFFAGSGTTGGAAMKMGRQFILVDQMDYTETVTRQRLINTINGDSHGISTTYGWKGGKGSFVYCELAMLNQKFVQQIEVSQTTAERRSILKAILETGFVSETVDLQVVRDNLDDFEALQDEEQKDLLMALLDKNMLYVNLSDMADEEYAISDTDKAFNRSFYKLKG